MNDRQFASINCHLCDIKSSLGVVPDAVGTITTEIVTGAQSYLADSYRQIQFMNTSSSLTATVNGQPLPPLGTVSYKWPRDGISRPQIDIVGNADGVRVDYENW